MEKETFKLHKFQGDAWIALDNPDIREIALVAGIQGGKTTFGALAMLHMVARCKVKNANFIVCADTFKTLSQATIPTFLKYFTKRLGTYKIGDQEFVLHKGGKIFFRTATDADSVEGIPDCVFAWMDEAGKCSRLFKVNVLGRVARLKGKVLYTSTPYSMNWLFSEVEKPWKSGERKDIAFVQFSSADNPAFPREEFDRQRLILDPKTFRRKYMGIHERLEGLVYEITENNYIDPQPLPKGTRIYGGIDFGFAEGHEFALIVKAITPQGQRIIIDEFKQSGLDPMAQVVVLETKRKIWNIEHFYCDPARPDMIALLNKSNLRASAFHIGVENYKQVVPGIQYIQSLIKQATYKIFRHTCPEYEDELETYHWEENRDGLIKHEEPVKVNDHLLDADRYVTIATMNIYTKEIKPEFTGFYRSRTIDTMKPTDKPKSKGNWDSY